MRPNILGMRVDPTSYIEATKQILVWAHERESRYVCVANVHMVMEAYDNPEYKAIINEADLVVPDGMPLVWMLRKMGFHSQERVYGPILTSYVLEGSERGGVSVGFLGSTPQVIYKMIANFKKKYPSLNISFAYSPPFRPLDEEEDLKLIEEINESKTQVLFVGLGCPKQEWWMASHKKKIKAVMVGVGAAFDFHAGVKPQAPPWIQNLGFEWLFRMLTEPRRLWKRYLYHNPRFIYLALIQLMRHRKKFLYNA